MSYWRPSMCMSSIRLHSRLLLGQPSVLLQAKKQVLHPRRNLNTLPRHLTPLTHWTPAVATFQQPSKSIFFIFYYSVICWLAWWWWLSDMPKTTCSLWILIALFTIYYLLLFNCLNLLSSGEMCGARVRVKNEGFRRIRNRGLKGRFIWIKHMFSMLSFF